MPAAGATRWGWHQLADGWARRLVQRAGVSPGDLVVDIGAGTGALTCHLVEAGARVLAVELHPARAAALRRRFAGSPVKVVQVDATQLWLPAQPYRVVANPPFAATSAVLRRLVAPGGWLVRADLVVPRHVAARWAAGRGHLTGRAAAAFHIAVTASVPASAFRPAPPAPAAVLTITRRSGLPSGQVRARAAR